MNRCMLFIVFASLSVLAEPSVNDEVEARISNANNMSSMVTIYRNFRGDDESRRIALQKIESSLQANKSLYVTASLQDEIRQDLQSTEPHLVRQAIETSGNLKIKGLKKAILHNFMDADKISGGHASGIRQASMVAIERINDTSLAQVYLQLMLDRKDFWYDGDLLMALQGLSAHGDPTCLDAVKELNYRLEGYMATPGGESEGYHKTLAAELLTITRNILTKLQEK